MDISTANVVDITLGLMSRVVYHCYIFIPRVILTYLHLVPNHREYTKSVCSVFLTCVLGYGFWV